MELNKRRSLLTPAAPTVWGMIHGDIDNQQDIVEKISDMVDVAVGVDLTNKIKGEIYTDLTHTLDTFATKEALNETNNKVSDIETTYIPQIEGYVDGEIVEVKGYVDSEVLNLKTYMDEQIGAIDTMTQDILG